MIQFSIPPFHYIVNKNYRIKKETVRSPSYCLYTGSVAAAGVASTATSSVVVGAVDDRNSDEDDPEALVVEKITDAVHISHFRRL